MGIEVRTIATIVAAVAATSAAFPQGAPTIVWANGGHADTVTSVDVSPDNQLLLTSSLDGTVKIWRRSDHMLVHTLAPFAWPLYRSEFTPDGNYVVAGSIDGVTLWDAHTGAFVRSFAGSGVTYSVTVSADQTKVAAAGGDATVHVWNFQTGAVENSIPVGGVRIDSVDLSPNGAFVATGNQDGRIRVWRTSDSVAVMDQTLFFEAYAVTFDASGQYLITGQEKARFFRTSDWGLDRTYDVPGQVYSLALSPDQQVLAVGCQSAMRFIRTSDGANLGESQYGGSKGVCFDKTGQTVYGGTLFQFSVPTFNTLNALLWHKEEVNATLFTPDGVNLVTISNDYWIKVARVADRQLVRSIDMQGEGACGALSKDGTLVAAGMGFFDANVWRMSDGLLVRTVYAGNGTTVAVAFSVDGQTLFTANSGLLRSWDIGTGALRYSINPFSTVRSIAVSPDGTAVYAGLGSGAINKYRASDGALIYSMPGPAATILALAVSNDGLYLVNSIDPYFKVYIRNAATGAVLKTLSGHTDRVYGVAFTPNAKTVMTASFDRTLKYWDVASGALIKSYDKDLCRLTSLVCSPNGKFAAVGRDDGTSMLIRNPLGGPIPGVLAPWP